MKANPLGDMMVPFSQLAEKLDASGMLGHLRNFPQDLARAWKAAEEWDLTAIENQQFSGVICLRPCEDGCLPFVAHRGYDLPTWFQTVLVLSTSYSGNTEETIDATASLGLGCSVVGMSSGGALQTLLESSNQIWIGAWRTTTTVRIWTHFGPKFFLETGITSPPDDLDSMIERLFEAVEACDFTDSEGDDVIGEMAERFESQSVC